MKAKKEYVILLVLIAGLSAYLVLRKPDRTHYQLPKLQNITESDISKIEIDKGGTSVVLDKKGSGWEIGTQGYPADTGKVKAILDTLKNLTLTALVSEAKDYNRYELDDAKKIRVRAWAADNLKRDFDVGKTAPTYRHTFVKLAGDDRVYHAQENFRSKLDQSIDDLRDKTVLSFDQAEIREISVTKGDKSVVLKSKEVPQETKAKAQEDKTAEAASPPKVETVWEDAGGKKADRKTLSDILSVLSSLKCEKYLHGTKDDFKNPIYEISMKGNKVYRLAIFNKKEKDAKEYPAVSSENGYPFLLSTWRADKIMKDPEQFLVKQATDEKAQEKPAKSKVKPKEG
jgi:hypothetical protein